MYNVYLDLNVSVHLCAASMLRDARVSLYHMYMHAYVCTLYMPRAFSSMGVGGMEVI